MDFPEIVRLNASLSTYGERFNAYRRVIFNGRTYKSKYFLFNALKDDMPIFFEIIYIFVYDPPRLIFCGKPYRTLEFNTHFHAYEIEKPENKSLSLSCLSECVDYNSYKLNFIGGKKFLSGIFNI